MTHWSTSLLSFISHPAFLLASAPLAVLVVLIARQRKLAMLVLRSLGRNRLRTALTAAAVAVLVLVVTGAWTILHFLNQVTEEKSKDLKAIVTERWQVPSQMPYAYAPALAEGAAKKPSDAHPTDSMTWSFYGGTLDPAKLTRENIVFFFVMDPRKLRTMMDALEDIDEALVQKLLHNKRGAIIGKERLAAMNKRVGERFKLTSLNYKGIDLEFEIVGAFPDGRYNQSAVMNHDYLRDALDAYAREHRGERHPMADKSLNLVWLRVPDTEAFRRVAEQIETSSQFTNPAVKCETASSGIASFLDAYRDLLWGLRWFLVPAVCFTMALVIANAISISVRERRTEIAVLKVLGFRPAQIMALVLGEALVIGVGAGLFSAGGAWLLTVAAGGIKFPIAFFPAFFVPADACWWGPAVGGSTALAGSIVPAWTAMRVRVSEVFSKVA
jgi:putative ABC transport system permease protein